MKYSSRFNSFSAMALAVAFCSLAGLAQSQVTIVNDTFDDADRNNDGTTDPGTPAPITPVADTLDIPYFMSGATTPTLAIVDDTGVGKLNTGNALLLTNTASTVVSAVGTLYTVGSNVSQASASSITLASGEMLTLSLDFRVLSTATANDGGLRFGIFGSNASLITGDNHTAQTTNDKGYYVAIRTGTTGPTTLYEEAGTATPIIGGNDRTALGSPVTSFISSSDTAPHNFKLTIALSGGTATLNYYLDNVLLITGTDSTPLLNFDEIGIGSGSGADFLIDNVNLTLVPEPQTLGMLLGSFGILVLAQRRRRERRVG